MRYRKVILAAMIFGLTSLGVSAQSYEEPLDSSMQPVCSANSVNAAVVSLLMQRMQLLLLDYEVPTGQTRTLGCCGVKGQRHDVGRGDVIKSRRYDIPEFRFTKDKGPAVWQTIGFIGVGIARAMINPNAPSIPDL